MDTPLAIKTALCAAALLSACAGLPTPTLSPADLPAALRALPDTALLLLGEQHDADAHQALERATVVQLAQAGRLAALVLEMAEQGTHTHGLAPDAGEDEVRTRLSWDEAGWPWARYGPVVMAAVRAGVPVLGGNQPRAEMRSAMADTGLDDTLAPAALARQRADIDQGHCGLLPASQLAPMARIQIARDRAMARTVVQAATEGRVVLLVAGAQHVQRGLGVPAHLPPEWSARSQVVVMHSGAPGADALARADRLWLTPATPPQDHCAELRQRLERPTAP